MTKQEETFWRKYLAGGQTSHFPSARIKGNVDDITREQDGKISSAATLTLDVEVSESALIAAWALVLSVHTLAEDVIFGLALGEQAEEALPFRVQVPEGSEITCLDLITSVQSTLDQITSARLQHNALSLDRISHIDAFCSEACAFSSCLEISSRPCKPAPFQAQSCPLLLICLRSNGLTELILEADAKLHSLSVQRNLLAHFRLAITAFSSHHDTLLDDVGLLCDPDVEQLESWTHAPEPISSQPFLHKEIEEQAHLHPLAIAIGQTDSVMTYAELDEGANVLARHLLNAASPPDGSIGNIAVFFSKSAFAILAMLAILKAGGAFVPIDTQWPTKRVEKIFKSAQITTVLCSEDQRHQLRAFSCLNVITITPKSIYDLKRTAQDGLPPPSPPFLRPEAPAYIMHTSGSTGQPKGVEISHQSITTSLNAVAHYFAMSPSTRTLQFSALTFDVSVADIWATLARGGRVCMPSEVERFSLNDFILAERCNFAFVTPSVAATIDPDIAKKHMCRLAVIGEAVKPEFLKRYAPTKQESEGDRGFVLCDTWGPTEASVFGTGSASITVSADGDNTLVRRAGNIGKPVGCGLFIVSTRNPHKLAPAYAPGEIALVGPTLATGYWGDEAKTKAAFRTDLGWAKDMRWTQRFGESVMGRVYLTGDIGRYSEEGDGSLVFMHRRGGYMKVNGLRIDPGEVETAVVEVGTKLSDGRRDAAPYWERIAVCVLEQSVGDGQQQILVCFLADSEMGGKPGMGCEKLEMSEARKTLLQDVAKSLKDIVPQYMVPGLFVSVEKMPFTTSFKLDRKALLGLLDGMGWSELMEKHAVESQSVNGVST